jgi:hypothetical protein
MDDRTLISHQKVPGELRTLDSQSFTANGPRGCRSCAKVVFE